MRGDGSGLRAVLRPRQGTSYLAAAALLRSGPFFIVRHFADGGRTMDRVFVADRRFQLTRALSNAMNGDQGYPAPEPDGHDVAYTASGSAHPLPALWIHTPTGDVQLTDPPPCSWDTGPAWSPNGKGLFFIRAARAKDGLSAQLMEVSAGTGEPRAVLGEAVSPLSICFSPSGREAAAVQRTGLELYDPATWRPIRLLAPWGRLPSARYRGSGATWAPSPDRVIFAAQDPAKPGIALIVSVRVSDGSARVLRRVRGYVTSICWLR